MAQFCLTKPLAEEFKRRLKSGEINPDQLNALSSAERHAFFAEFLGEDNATQVNALVESKLILKNVNQGLVSAMKKILGEQNIGNRTIISKIEKAVLHDTQVQKRMDAIKNGTLELKPGESVGQKILSVDSLEQFKADLVDHIIGGKPTLEEANQLVAISKEVTQAKIEALKIVSKPGFDLKKETPQDRLTRTEYGVKLAILKEYVADLQLREQPGLKGLTESFWSALKDPKRYHIVVGNLTKSIKASFDNIFFLNQGIHAFYDPLTTGKWFLAFGKSWGDIGKSLAGENPIIGIKGEIYARPNSLNGNYERMRIAIGLHTEEAIPTTIMEKIPVVGRFFKASNTAYNGAAIRLRADIADMYIVKAKKDGINLKDKKEAESLGQIVNSFTGRGDTGRMSGEQINAIFFSPKFVKSKFDVLTAHIFSDKVSAYGKKQAAWSWLRIVGVSTLTLLLSETLNPGSTDLDTRGTNFGKIKIGNTWYPTALSFGGIPTLLARTIIPTKHNGQWGLWMKTSKGKFYNLQSDKFGAITAKDIFESYIEGKASPIGGAVLDAWRGEDFDGNKSTPENILKNLVTPITVGNLYKNFNNPAEEYKVFSAFMQILGSNASKPR